MSVDASEHINLVRHVIRGMGLYGDLAEECFSEGLVALTIAAQRYDPDKGASVAHWLATNIRFSLLAWLKQQRQAYPFPEYFEAPQEDNIARQDLTEVLALMDKLLTQEERVVVMSKGLGYQTQEIAKMLGVSSVKISRVYHSSLRKLKEAWK